jgi:VCBS repeat-containing protein
MATGSDTTLDFDPYGAATTDAVLGTSGNDRLFGGAGNDLIDAGAGSDEVKGGSGDDVMIYNLSANLNGALDTYTGGSGFDTVRIQLTQSQWMDASIRQQLESYVAHIASVARNPAGEVSAGSGSDFTFNFANGTKLTVQMTERLQVAVQAPSGQYMVVDHLAALITGTAGGAVVEAGSASAGSPIATGDLNSDDLNGADDSFQAVAAGTASIGGYGTYAVTSAGVWAYTLDNANATVQALNAGQVLTDTFKVVTTDGSMQTVSITIQGSNDAAEISGSSSGSVVEAAGADPGTPTASGDLDATDVDNPNDDFQAGAGDSDKGYGTYGVNAAGQWTYTLENGNTDKPHRQLHRHERRRHQPGREHHHRRSQ